MNKEETHKEFEDTLQELKFDFDKLKYGKKVDEEKLAFNIIMASALGAKLVDEYGFDRDTISDRIDEVLG